MHERLYGRENPTRRAIKHVVYTIVDKTGKILDIILPNKPCKDSEGNLIDHSLESSKDINIPTLRI